MGGSQAGVNLYQAALHFGGAPFRNKVKSRINWIEGRDGKKSRLFSKEWLSRGGLGNGKRKGTR